MVPELLSRVCASRFRVVTREPGELRGMDDPQNGKKAKVPNMRLSQEGSGCARLHFAQNSLFLKRKGTPGPTPGHFGGVPPVLGSRGETRGGQNQLPTPNSRQERARAGGSELRRPEQGGDLELGAGPQRAQGHLSTFGAPRHRIFSPEAPSVPGYPPPKNARGSVRGVERGDPGASGAPNLPQAPECSPVYAQKCSPRVLFRVGGDRG